MYSVCIHSRGQRHQLLIGAAYEASRKAILLFEGQRQKRKTIQQPNKQNKTRIKTAEGKTVICIYSF